jgi:peptidoglycan hydrolase-like protein with peptidoglycan-binding domain
MTNNAITNLQIYLRQLSYTDPNLLPVPIDGIYELETQNAVIAFQAKHNLETTGIVNKATWDAIYAEYLKSIIKYALISPKQGILLCIQLTLYHINPVNL